MFTTATCADRQANTLLSRPPLVALCLFILSLLFGSHGATATANTARKILDAAQQQESLVTTGNVRLRRNHQYWTPTDRDLRSIVTDPQQLVIELNKRKARQPNVIEDSHLIFDNVHSRLLMKGSRNSQVPSYQHLFTRQYKKIYQRIILPAPEKPIDELDTSNPTWPPFWPYNFWSQRYWDGTRNAILSKAVTLKLYSYNPATGIALLDCIGGPQADLDQTISVDTRHGYTIRQIKLYNKQTKRLEMEATASYKRLPSGIWYPSMLTEAFYTYARSGKRYRPRLHHTTAVLVSLNQPVSARDLAVGPIRRGTRVQDNRFTPPLTYIQREKDLSDHELFVMSRNRQRSVQNPPSARASDPVSYSLVAFGSILLLSSIVFGSRYSRR